MNSDLDPFSENPDGLSVDQRTRGRKCCKLCFCMNLKNLGNVCEEQQELLHDVILGVK